MTVIDSTLRNKLNEYAPKYYKQKKNGNKEKTDEIFNKLGLDTHGFDCVEAGEGRQIYDMSILGYPDYVLKLAIHSSKYDGQEQNKKEVKLWDNATDSQRDFLVPVVEHGPDYFWLIMPFGDQDIEYNYKRIQDLKYELRDLVWDEELREEHYVKVNGKIKLCDYGVKKE